MRNKKLLLTTGVLMVIVAAFIVGRLFGGDIDPIGSDKPVREGSRFTLSTLNNIAPSALLPTLPPEFTGLYLEMKDNTMTIQVVSFDPGLGGVVGDASVDVNSAPKAEIFMTSKTAIYRDTTESSQSVSRANITIPQTVEESSLDQLAPPTIITVWGHKSGDRVIATVLLFGNSLNIQKP